MKLKTQKNATLFSLFSIAYWFFGNLYEAIVFGPNWNQDNQEILHHLNSVFIKSSPNAYFVPMTLLAVLSVWIITYLNKIDTVKKEYRMASILTLIITILTSLIVALVLSKMFGPGFYENQSQGSYYGTLWNYLNGVRMILEVATLYYLFTIYRKLDKI